jgi:hypothetical protein
MNMEEVFHRKSVGGYLINRKCDWSFTSYGSTTTHHLHSLVFCNLCKFSGVHFP